MGRTKTQSSRITVLENGITVWSNGNLKLETGQIQGRSGKSLDLTAGYCIWMYSGESGILMEPNGIQMESPELEFESPWNEVQELPEDSMVSALLRNYEKKKSYPVPTVASDGSMVRRTGYEEILYSDEIYEYFEHNVLGTEGYENAMEQPPDLIYQCWLDDVYGRSDLGKFWDYTGSVEGIQTILAVAGIFWNGADLINMVISLCMGDWEAAWWFGVCALPFIGEKLGAGGKWLTSSTRLGQAAKESKVLQNLTLIYKVPAGKLDDFARYLRDIMDTMPGLQGDIVFLIEGQEVMNGSSSISFRICEEASEAIYEDVWRLSDEKSWWFMKVDTHSSFANNIDDILVKQGLTLEEFNNLRLSDLAVLSDTERTALRTIRESIPMPNSNTLLQKVIPVSDIEKYLNGTYTQIGGYVTRAEDVAHLSKYDDLYDSLRLDYPGSVYKPMDDDSIGIIRYTTDEASKISIPYGIEMGGVTTEAPPFTGNGFTKATNGEIIPEFKCDGYLNIEDGAQLIEISHDGTETLKAVFDEIKGRFISIE